MTTTFDPVTFKSTTRAQWEAAAEAWHRWGPAIEDWLGAATGRCSTTSVSRTGARVLDVAAGAGGQTLAAARRVGPTGHVLATDISPGILEYAAEAAPAGLGNVETLEADGEDLSAVGTATYDAAISRVGLIYFPDQQRALTEICRTLRPGGRLSSVVYSTADRNGFFSVPVGIIRRVAGLPAPAPGLPGPFSLGAPVSRRRRTTRPGWSTSRSRRSPRRSACRARPSASGSSRSPSAPCTRCSPLSTTTNARRHGARSRRRSASSRDPTASSGRARCSSSPARAPDPHPGLRVSAFVVAVAVALVGPPRVAAVVLHDLGEVARLDLLRPDDRGATSRVLLTTARQLGRRFSRPAPRGSSGRVGRTRAHVLATSRVPSRMETMVGFQPTRPHQAARATIASPAATM